MDKTSSDGNCTQDTKTVAMGKSAMQSLTSVWKNKDISTNTSQVAQSIGPVDSNSWE